MITLSKTRRTMLLAILNYITDSGKTAFTSVAGVFVGQASLSSGLSGANTALQHAAWTVAILAGLLTIANLFFPLRTFYEDYKTKRKEQFIKEHEDED